MAVKHFIFLLSVSLTACSTTITPIRSTVNKLEAKIENPEKGKVYRMSSTRRETSVVGKLDDDAKTVTFDISGFSKESGKCYYFYEGMNHIPIKDKIFSFTNPAIERYVPVVTALRTAQDTLDENKKSLGKHVAYRNGQCIFLSRDDMPAKPSSACHPHEEASFGRSLCADTTFNPTFETKLANWLKCFGAGGVAGAAGGPVIAAATGLVCSFMTSKIDEQDQYTRCLATTINMCRSSYSDWANNVKYLENNSEELQQKCVETQQTIQRATVRTYQLNLEANNSAQAMVPITDIHYCRQ